MFLYKTFFSEHSFCLNFLNVKKLWSWVAVLSTGSLVLVGGDPGVGKSTLLLQVYLLTIGVVACLIL